MTDIEHPKRIRISQRTPNGRVLFTWYLNSDFKLTHLATRAGSWDAAMLPNAEARANGLTQYAFSGDEIFNITTEADL